MNHFTPRPAPATRPAYRETPAADLSAYRNAQRELFGACRDAGLPTDDSARTAMILAIARYLGDRSITSRTQLTPGEMRLLSEAVRRGFFTPQWLLRAHAQSAALLRTLLEIQFRRAQAAQFAQSVLAPLHSRAGYRC